jgi:hypothetical protein
MYAIHSASLHFPSLPWTLGIHCIARSVLPGNARLQAYAPILR